jgi:hypothetical protein
MSRKYGASHDFDKVPSANIDRSSFNRSHGSKFTCDAGLIVPIFVDEVLPGDTFNCRHKYDPSRTNRKQLDED